ncbi:MAG: hypothetical protein U9N55_07120, partial [candidate division Zixibacteria bacterium]|nr:hypothetical protein [candidate division Zixibacteria bacterium]
SIPGNDGTKFIADGFSFTVSPDATEGYLASFDLSVTGTNRDTWTGEFSLEIHRPNVSYLTVAVTDIGNGNGVLDPGETAELVVSLSNSGSGQATNTSAILSETDTWVSVTDDYGDFGTINVLGGSASNTVDVFEVSADGSCTPGHEMTFNLAVSADNGYTANLSFDFIVGDRMSYFVDDFSSNKGWTGIGGDAEWTIGPATGGSGEDASGNPDPALDHTPTEDNGVLGNDLTIEDGDYNANIGTTQWITSPVIDCGDFASVQMTFYRYLGAESSDHVYFQVYDGSGWIQLFYNSSTYNESSWNEQFFDVSSYADGNNSFRVRFGLGSTNSSNQYCGWNIDDFSLKGYDQSGGVSPSLEITQTGLSDSLVEGSNNAHTVNVFNNGDGELRISFNSPESWISCSEDINYVIPSGNLDFPVTFDATGLAPGDYTGSLYFSSNDFSQMAGELSLTLHVYAPICNIPVSSVDATVEPGNQKIVPLTINNDGPGRLTYNIGCQTFEPKIRIANPGQIASERGELLGYRLSGDDKNEESPFFASSDKNHGGPDMYGYSWIDSDDPGGPAFSWVDISATGTLVELGDDACSDAIDMGFNFPYYENEYSQLFIGSNGIITFGTGNSSHSNVSIPSSIAPNNLISLWWDDIDPGDGGAIYYYHDVAGGRFIVSFDAVPNYQYPDGTGSLNFQAIFYPNGKFTIQYATMDPGSDSEGLSSASIGIENAVGDDGLEVVYNSAYMHDNMAIDFSVVRWLWVEPSGGLVEPYSQATVDVHFDAIDLENGSYTGQMSITTNDPLNPALVLPVTLGVQSFICGDVNGNGEEPNVSDITYLVTYLFNGGPPPPVLAAADCDGVGGDEVNVSDVTYLVTYLFNGGPPPICH